MNLKYPILLLIFPFATINLTAQLIKSKFVQTSLTDIDSREKALATDLSAGNQQNAEINCFGESYLRTNKIIDSQMDYEKL